MSDQEIEKVKLDIPATGSLGLLALGDVGLKAWRKKRAEVKKQNMSNRENKGNGEKTS